MQITEKELWQQTADLHTGGQAGWTGQEAALFRDAPFSLTARLARYKFASKMACKDKTVLEWEARDALGSPILREFAADFCGFGDDPSGKRFQTVVCFEGAISFISNALRFLTEDGILITGEQGCDPREYKERLRAHFYHVFLFGMNGVAIHNDIFLAPYLLGLCCYRKGPHV